MSEPSPASVSAPQGFTGRRSAARLAAVQILYQYHMLGRQTPLMEILEGFEKQMEQHPKEARKTYGLAAQPDKKRLREIVQGIAEDEEIMAAQFEPSLIQNGAARRIEPLHWAILMAAVCEMRRNGNTPPPIILDEYTKLSEGFFDPPELGLVNAILDDTARRMRADDFSAKP